MVGAMLVAGAAMCAGGASRAAPTIGGFLDAAGFALAAEGDGGFSLAPTAGEWFAADGLAIPDDDGFASGPSADGIEASSTERATAASTADFASGASGDGVVTGGLADWIRFDTARMPAPMADFPTGSSGVFVSPIEDLTSAPTDANATPAPAATGDILVEDTVPALAAFGLLAAGLLALGVMRRRRRAAAARRIKLGLDQRRRALRQ
jgi:hypothetical protein